MTFRHFVLGGAAAVALAALVAPQAALSANPPVVAAAATTPLDKVNNPMTALARLQVVSREGRAVGTVVDVVTRSDGKALIVTVDAALGGPRRRVGIQANQLGLDQNRHILVASLTTAQIKALPAI